jgi:pimeloyl-ACP methyl ester carboxylesterase
MPVSTFHRRRKTRGNTAMRHLVSLSLIGVLAIAPGLAADTPPAAPSATKTATKLPADAIRGNWLGTIKIRTIKLRIAIAVTGEPGGSLKGTFASVDQDNVPHPLDQVALDGDKIRLAFKQAHIVIEGTLNAEGTEIDSKFKQGLATFPIVFKKVDKAPESAKRPQEPKRPFPYKEVEVTYQNPSEHSTLAGTLTLPKTGGPFPAVLLITGSGQQDRDETIFGHKPFLVLSDYLTRRGIAVLRVDDRGVGGSKGDLVHATSANFASDVLAGVDFLKTRKEIDPHKIGLIGHSEGGIIAPMVAVKSPDLAFIVLLAGTGVPGSQISIFQMETLLKQSGASEADIAKSRNLQQKLYAILEHETDAKTRHTKLKQAFEEGLAGMTAEEKKKAGAEANPEQSAAAVERPWTRFYFFHDPRETLRQVHCPVLALNGDKDIQVPSKVNLPEIEKALKEGGNTDYTMKRLPDLNHLFQTCKKGTLDEYATIEETMSPTALEIIADWITRHSREGSK